MLAEEGLSLGLQGQQCALRAPWVASQGHPRAPAPLALSELTLRRLAACVSPAVLGPIPLCPLPAPASPVLLGFTLTHFRRLVGLAPVGLTTLARGAPVSFVLSGASLSAQPRHASSALLGLTWCCPGRAVSPVQRIPIPTGGCLLVWRILASTLVVLGPSIHPTRT